MRPTAEDREAARNLIARQKFYTDDRDIEGIAGCWAATARLELHINGGGAVEVSGRDEILKFVEAGWARSHGDRHVHLITTMEIRDREDGGLGVESYCAYLSDSAEMRIVGYGRYTDVLAVEDGAWRIATRSVRIKSNFAIDGRGAAES